MIVIAMVGCPVLAAVLLFLCVGEIQRISPEDRKSMEDMIDREVRNIVGGVSPDFISGVKIGSRTEGRWRRNGIRLHYFYWVVVSLDNLSLSDRDIQTAQDLVREKVDALLADNHDIRIQLRLDAGAVI